MICNHKLAEVYMSVQEHIPLEITTAKASFPKANLEEEIDLGLGTEYWKRTLLVASNMCFVFNCEFFFILL